MKIQSTPEFQKARQFKLFPVKMEHLDDDRNFITEYWIKFKIGSSRKKRYIGDSNGFLRFKTFDEAMNETKRLCQKFETDFNLPGKIENFA